MYISKVHEKILLAVCNVFYFLSPSVRIHFKKMAMSYRIISQPTNESQTYILKNIGLVSKSLGSGFLFFS